MDSSKDTYPSLRSFINQTRALLRREQEAEMQAFQDMTTNKSAVEIQDEGVGLTNMVVQGSKDGFYGKVILTLAKYHYSQKNKVTLPEHCKLGVGDDVAILNGKNIIAEGVVYRRTPQKIRVSLSLDPEQGNFDYLEEDRIGLNIVLKWNQVTYRRYFGILDTLENPRLQFPITSFFFKETARNYVPKKPQPFVSNKLNQMQNNAISHGLVQTCHLIHGPPGTGKTTTVCELIVEAVARGQKVLACAPSNIAVDNIVEGIAHRVNCVRVGNPARVINSIIQRCLDFLITKQEGQWKSQEKKLNAASKKIKRCKDRKEKRQLYDEIKQLRGEVQTMQQQVIEEILLDADVICCTNAGAGDKIFRRYLSKRVFDLVVIDECGQGLEVSCWIPLIRGKRVVLAGDHKQLPPTVKFQTQSLLSYTLFSRAMEELTYLGSTMLEVQYRMNRIIMGWSNKQFYNNKLVAHQSVEAHTLQQIYTDVDQEDAVILMIDTTGCQMGEEGGSMESKFNQGQADIIVSVYKKLLKYGVQAKNIAVLTPYSKQVTLIKNLMATADVEMSQISTVDGIQGREKQCILISMVRSNPKHQIGFLKDWRRMNVAITRARRMLILVGDSDCVSSDPKIANLVEWIGTHGSIQSAEQFRYDTNVRFGLGKISDNKPVQKIQQTEIKEQAQKKTKANKTKKQKKEKEKEKKQNNADKKPEKAAKILHTQQELQTSKDQFRKKLQNLKDEQTFFDLNAYDRKIVHEVAEEYGYLHVTSDDKKMITVKVLKETVQSSGQQSEEDQEIQQKERAKKTKQNKKKEIKVVVQKVPQNMKELIGDQSSDEDEKPEEKKKVQESALTKDKTQKKDEEKPNKKKNKKKKGQTAQKQGQEEDWEKLLQDFTADMPKKDQCFKCKKKITSVTSAQCKYCNLHFCRHDLLAEQHGCQDAARQYARKGGNIDRFLEEGSRKIQQKLKEQQDKRKKKKKESEKPNK